MYQLTNNACIIRVGDGACIPADPTNRDYAEYLAWVAAGNKPLPYAAPPPTVPHSITPRQARIALSRAGVLDAVTAAIAAMEGQPGIEARLTWEFATEVQRSDPLIQAMAGALSLSDTDLDQLFELAATV